MKNKINSKKIIKSKMLSKKDIIKKIEKNKDKLKEKSIKKIGVFGSYIKNKQNKKSDIDILVEFKKPTFDNYAEVIMLLEKVLRGKIDLITKKSLRPELKHVKNEVQYARL